MVLISDSSDSEEESLFGPHSSKRNSWNERPNQRSTGEPQDSTSKPPDSSKRRGSDKELQAFISMRDQTDQATEEWEKLNYDIYTLRYARREVRSRWKKILLQLGDTEIHKRTEISAAARGWLTTKLKTRAARHQSKYGYKRDGGQNRVNVHRIWKKTVTSNLEPGTWSLELPSETDVSGRVVEAEPFFMER
ncbi:melanoregulin-like isoform X2 [Xyrichtys novacula]|uniref:Melanoregulin-like isoform X2 n=1 Tax=Xyrichtys novacula TaxID=13765 RepID=A0AAV1GEW6_XYRNO|nr:melanoregulin-like isoform X2 [Xyrichtys novacula]